MFGRCYGSCNPRAATDDPQQRRPARMSLTPPPRADAHKPGRGAATSRCKQRAGGCTVRHRETRKSAAAWAGDPGCRRTQSHQQWTKAHNLSHRYLAMSGGQLRSTADPQEGVVGIRAPDYDEHRCHRQGPAPIGPSRAKSVRNPEIRPRRVEVGTDVRPNSSSERMRPHVGRLPPNPGPCSQPL